MSLQRIMRRGFSPSTNAPTSEMLRRAQQYASSPPLGMPTAANEGSTSKEALGKPSQFSSGKICKVNLSSCRIQQKPPTILESFSRAWIRLCLHLASILVWIRMGATEHVIQYTNCFFGGAPMTSETGMPLKAWLLHNSKLKLTSKKLSPAPFALGSRKIDRKLDICQPAGYVGFRNLAVALPCEAGLGLADQHHVIH